MRKIRNNQLTSYYAHAILNNAMTRLCVNINIDTNMIESRYLFMEATSTYHVHFSHMIREMANELNMHRKKEAKTMVVNRIVLYKLIDFIAIYHNVKDSDIAEELGISNRTLYGIKHEPRTDSPDYTSIRTTTIDTVIEYTYDLAERVEQKGEMIAKRG